MEEIDCAVEKRRFELTLEIDVVAARFHALNVASEVNEGDNMNGELAQDRADNVRIEDVGLRTFFRETFDGLRRLSVLAKIDWEKKSIYLCSRD